MIKKRITALLLAIGMLMSTGLAACSSSSSDSGSSSDSTTDSDGFDKTTITSWDDENLSWIEDADREVTMDCYIDFDWYSLDTWGEDDVSQYITELTGVTLNVTKASDTAQLLVLLAADELPELIFTSNQVTRYYDTAYTYSFTELFDEYCPEMWNLVDETELANNTQSDGLIYTLKSHYSSDSDWEDERNLPSPGDSGFHYRADLLEELGFDSISSIEELEEVFAAAHEAYPDLITYLPHPTWLSPFYEYFGISPSPTSAYYEYDTDTVQFGMFDENLVDYFLFLNRCYLNGYLSAEAYTYEPEQFFQIVRSGSVFSASYNTGFSDDTNKNYYDANGIDAYMSPQIEPLTYEDELLFEPVDASVGWASFFISKNCTDPEKAIEYVEFLKSPDGDALTQWGIEDLHYTLTDEGYILRTDYYYDSSNTTGVGPWYFMASGLGEGVAVSSAKVSDPDYSQYVDLLYSRKSYYSRDPVLAFVIPDADTDEYTIYTKIQDLYNNSHVSIITSESQEACAAAVEELIANAYSIGADTLIEYQTEAYAEAALRYE